MENKLKTVKVITMTLLVILLTIFAFLGLYVKKNNIWTNIIPELNYGMELDGTRELRFELDTTEEEKRVYIDSEGNILGEVKEETSEETTLEDGVSLETEDTKAEEVEKTTQEETNKTNYATEVRKIKANDNSVRTIQNYEKSKKIIQNRLEQESPYEYNIRLNSITGELIVEVPNDDDVVTKAKSAVTTKGVLEIIDEQNGLILLDSDDITKIQTGVYENAGYQVCIQIAFNEEGTEKLRKISNEYRTVVNEAGESSTTYVSVTIDGQTLLTTYFGEEITEGILQIPIGNATTDTEELTLVSEEAERLVNILNGEQMPILYVLSTDTLMKSSITDSDINIAKIVLIAVLLIISVLLIIKFKSKGYIASILAIGFVSLYVLTLKCLGTDIKITLNSAVAFLSIIVLNYVFTKKMLLEFKNSSDRKESFLKVMKNYYLIIVPICIITVIFTLVSSTLINSIGMVFFWGLILQFLYNTLTIYTLKLF